MSSLKQICDLIPLGPNDEQLHIASTLEQGENKFGDIEYAFQVADSDGIVRYRIVLTVAKLRPMLVSERPKEQKRCFCGFPIPDDWEVCGWHLNPRRSCKVVESLGSPARDQTVPVGAGSTPSLADGEPSKSQPLEHVESPDCWCQPEVEYEDDEVRVILHRRPQ